MMGHQGMRYSLVSREVIADCIEVVAGGMNHDGLLAFGGCDKNMPGCVMAMARLNIPSIFVYGGSILPGIGADGDDIDIVSIFEAVGQYQAGKLDEKGVHDVECEACPGAGSCGGMYTANTMSPAPSRRWACRCPTTPAIPPCPPPRSARRSWPARRWSQLIEKDIRPRDIITRKSLENAYTLVLALGGSTNAVLHLMAIAREAEVEWTLADFDRLGDKVPHLADLKPGGKLRHERPAPASAARRRCCGRCSTPACCTATASPCTGADAGREPQGRAEHLRAQAGRRSSRSTQPMHATGHIVILHGNLAPEGAVAKVAGLKKRKHHRAGQGLRRRGGLLRRHPGSARSSRATSSSSAAKARSAARACARCSR